MFKEGKYQCNYKIARKIFLCALRVHFQRKLTKELKFSLAPQNFFPPTRHTIMTWSSEIRVTEITNVHERIHHGSCKQSPNPTHV